MTSKWNNTKKEFVKKFVIVLVFVNLLLLVSVSSSNTHSNLDADYFPYNTPPITQSFSKDDYEPILTEAKYSLGNISVTDMSFEGSYGKGYDFVGNYIYDDLTDDIYNDALNITYNSTKFIETINPAIVDNLNENITDNFIISVKVNETLNVRYNMSVDMGVGKQVEGYLIYYSRLFPQRLVELHVQNDTEPVQQVDDGNYTVDDINWLKFDYYNFFGGVNATNFSMYVIYEYNITIGNWALTQYEDPDHSLIITEQTQIITPEFKYQFNLNGKRYNGTTDLHGTPPFENYTIPAYDINFQLNICLPDKDLLKNHALTLNGVDIPDNELQNYLGPDNTMNVSDDFDGDNSLFSLNFEADFQIYFYEAVGETWAIDRLVNSRNIRERIYFPSILSGPETIYLRSAIIFESTIIVDQVISNSSLFLRNVNYFDANISVIEEDIHNSLIFTENVTKKNGLEIFLPYMIKGEICPFILKYIATRSLRIVITDNINMPLTNLQVEIYYYGVKYGTYISNHNYQPMSPAITNENGEISLSNVPDGNYTLKVFQNGQLLIETSISAYVDVNYVVTDIPHLPLWIIVFGSINVVIICVGLVKYRKNKR